MTNADRIRSMTDEELLDFIYQYEVIGNHCPPISVCAMYTEGIMCNRCWLNWLREEVNENGS